MMAITTSNSIRVKAPRGVVKRRRLPGRSGVELSLHEGFPGIEPAQRRPCAKAFILEISVLIRYHCHVGITTALLAIKVEKNAPETALIHSRSVPWLPVKSMRLALVMKLGPLAARKLQLAIVISVIWIESE